MGKLVLKGLLKLVFGFVVIFLLLFLSAGTLHYYQGWLFIIALFIPMLIAGVVLCIRDPKLLEKRLNIKETEKTQKTVIKLSGLMFILGFVVAGLNFRFGWIVLPFPVSIVATIVFLMVYVMYIEILRENEYLSRTIEIQENQKVVDIGFYSIIRHPMYSVTLLLFMIMPFLLGSIPSVFIFIFYPFIIAKRIKNEEIVLREGLQGYDAYMKKVKYRLVPFIW